MNNPSQTPSYDAFGDRVAGGDAFGNRVAGGRTAGTVTHRARNAAVAIFWSFALLLVAGRVYQHNATSQPHAIELASR